MINIFNYILFLFLIYFSTNTNSYLIKKNGKKQIISLKPEMKRYCTTNNFISKYDRLTCLKTLSDYPIKEEELTTNSEYFELMEYEKELQYQKYKIEKEKVNNKLKQMQLIYMINQL